MQFLFGSLTFSLQWRKGLSKELIEQGLVRPGLQVSGVYIPEEKAVKLSAHLKRLPGELVEVLIHELLHVIERERRANLKEHKVDELAFGLAEILTRNPKVWRLLKEAVENRIDAQNEKPA